MRIKYNVILAACALAYSLNLFSQNSYFVQTLSQCVPLSDTLKHALETCATHCKSKSMHHDWFYDRPLFSDYPSLSKSLPCIELADLPTPISQLTNVESYYNKSCKLFIKDDGLTGQIENGVRSFGGNKIRKLEFLLADARAHGAQSVMTYGCIGSNHVVATAVSSKKLGLRCIAQLSPQDVTHVVKRNMLLMGEHDTTMILNPHREIRSMQTICSYVQNIYKNGDIPYFIPTGGSCPIGIIGFVNAAFELKEQIKNGDMPEPDYIYVATGSCGTLVGLMLGARTAGLKSKIIGIAVEPNDPRNSFTTQVLSLLKQTNKLLHEKDPAFPLFEWHPKDVTIHLNFGGPDYGVITPEALQAIDFFQKKEGIGLDTTYTGKAAAGMLADIASGMLDNSVVLFWHTFCADVPEPQIEASMLSKPFHQFF